MASMQRWLRFRHRDRIGFGTTNSEQITEYSGNLFAAPEATGRKLALAEVELLPPVSPSKIVALWNNFHALSAKLGVPEPSEPLYLLKAPSSITAPDATVRRPLSYDGKIVWEGELGIVIGKTTSGVSADKAGEHIFGYTCVNDLTAADLIGKDKTFAQWARAKSFDGFCPFGPVIATGLDPASLIVRTIVNGTERQSYPISDMIFSTAMLVSKLSQDMTLLPGDLICCGTSLGVGSLKEPVSSLLVAIEGVGELKTEFRL